MLLIALSQLALAHDSGQTGNSTSGCSCHSGSATSSTTAAFAVAATTVAPGDAINVEFAVSTTVSSRTHAGLDVSASGGSLGAGSNTQRRAGEVTHSAPEAMSSGTVTFDFTWTAPATEGSYTLRGVGQAVNFDGSDNGDAWNNAGDLTLLVDDGCDDTDGDGYEACDDGSGDDCDDADALIFPGASELCDGVDHDCDGATDEADSTDAGEWFFDADADDYGDASARITACDLPFGYVADDTDCDDTDPLTYPFAAYTCAEGGDCGYVAFADATDAGTWYQDADGDGYGTDSTSLISCAAPPGYVAAAAELDCDDGASTTHPLAAETCNFTDDDCDGSTDEEAVDETPFYADADGDGYGDETLVETACDAPTGYADLAGDCDDTDAAFHPSAAEDCAVLVDYNCDGSVADEDSDADGFVACEDCDDSNADRNPDALEYCNGADDDCDGEVDETSSVDALSWYADADDDGYGDATASTMACDEPAGYVADLTDCDDSEETTFVGAEDVWYDGADSDCDGANDYDQDGDGENVDTDCDDLDASVQVCADTGADSGAPTDSGADTALPDETGSPPETGDTAAAETGSDETGSAETGTSETGQAETGASDTSGEETGVLDTETGGDTAPNEDSGGHQPDWGPGVHGKDPGGNRSDTGGCFASFAVVLAPVGLLAIRRRGRR